MSINELFEHWLSVHFEGRAFNKNFGVEGYEDDLINTLWIGFNAGLVYSGEDIDTL